MNVNFRLTFWWLVPLLKLGYNVPLELTDLTPLPPEEQVKTIFIKLKKKLSSASSGLFHNCIMLNKTLLIFGAFLRWKSISQVDVLSNDINNFRLTADLLSFSGALGIELIVSSLQNDLSDKDQLICNTTYLNSSTSQNMSNHSDDHDFEHLEETDSLRH